MNKIWYKKAAENWNEAIPVGNGRLGAMVYGRTGHEIIQLNEESVWSRTYTDRNNESAAVSLKEIREMLNLGRVQEAQELVFETFTGLPQTQASYESAGELHLDFYDGEHSGLTGPSSERKNVFDNCSVYRRELDLETAIQTTSFTTKSPRPSTADFSAGQDGATISYSREVFIPAEADVLIVRITATTPKSIYLRARFERDVCSKKYSLAEDTIVMQNTAGIPFAAVLMASSSGGTTTVRGDNLVIESADEVTLYVDVQTAYRNSHYQKKGGNIYRTPSAMASWCADRALKNICFASGASYESLRSQHIAEYSEWYKDIYLSLSKDESEEKEAERNSTEELIAGGSEKASLCELYWNFCRYAMISSVRAPGTLPAFSSGLWFDSQNSYEKKRYSLEEKIPLVTDVCGLGTADKVIFDLCKKIYLNGKKTASKMYSSEGYAAHSQTDIWGDTVPCGSILGDAYKNLGAAFAAIPVQEHFEYTLDTKFLKKNWYLLKEACNFFADYLIPVDEGKKLTLLPSFTDEKDFFVCEQTLSDTKTIAALANAALKAAEALKIPENNSNVVKFRSLLDRLKFADTLGDDSAPKAAFEKPAALLGNNISDLSQMTAGIIDSTLCEGRVLIDLLSAVPKGWNSGSLKGAHLKGNMRADISWKNGVIETARLYTKNGTEFIKDITVCYCGKKYNSQLMDGALDILNVLPSTLAAV